MYSYSSSIFYYIFLNIKKIASSQIGYLIFVAENHYTILPLPLYHFTITIINPITAHYFITIWNLNTGFNIWKGRAAFMVCFYLCEIINCGIKVRKNIFAKWTPQWNDFLKMVLYEELQKVFVTWRCSVFCQITLLFSKKPLLFPPLYPLDPNKLTVNICTYCHQRMSHFEATSVLGFGQHSYTLIRKWNLK